MEENRQFSSTIYVRTEELKSDFVSTNCNQNYYNDQKSWTQLQELQNLYKKLLLSDIEYSLEKKVEIDLWNFCFKDYITYLQLQLKNARELEKQKTNNTVPGVIQNSCQGVRRAAETKGVDLNITLQWFLEMANGFFILLFEEICLTFDLHFTFLKRTHGFDHPRYGYSEKTSALRKRDLKEKLDYICQFCLVHLGDIARYQNDVKQAEIYYRQAIEVSPASGQAYNQIALLHAIAGNNLSAITYYVRSISLMHPFPAASTNLTKMFGGISSKITEKRPINKSTFVNEFLQFHALLHEARSLPIAYELCCALNEAITSLIATESLKTLQLLQMVLISIFQFERISGELSVSSIDNDNRTKTEILSPEEKVIRTLVIESIAGMLNAILLPVYTLMQGKSLLKYFALPAAKLLLDWIIVNPDVLQEAGFLKRLQIWPSLCQVLNELSSTLAELDLSELLKSDLEYYPLPEDYDLRAYLPLKKRLSSYKYAKVTHQKPIDSSIVCALRARRMIDLGRLICNIEIREVLSPMKVVEVNVDEKKVEKFEANELQFISKHIGEDILTDLENLKVQEQFSDEENDKLKDNDMKDAKLGCKNTSIPEDSEKSFAQPKEPVTSKHNDEQVQVVRKGQRTNVAMQAILRQSAVSTDHKSSGPEKQAVIGSNKQVQFQSPNPLPGIVGATSKYPNINFQERKHRGVFSEDSKKYTDVVNANRGMVLSSNNLPKDISALPNPGQIDFSVPPPSLTPGHTAIMASRKLENRNQPNLVLNTIPNAISDSLISHKSHHLYSQGQITPNEYLSHSYHNNRSLAPQMLGTQMQLPTQPVQNASSIWPSYPQHRLNANLDHLQSDVADRFRYQLPQFGGISGTEKSLPTTNSVFSNSKSEIESDKLQFTHPYPSNKVRDQINNSSDDSTNRASPMYHRLFSTDPTWSVTPGSLPPTNTVSPSLDSLLKMNLGDEMVADKANITNHLNAKELSNSDNISSKK